MKRILSLIGLVVCLIVGEAQSQTWNRLDRPDTNVSQTNINSFRRRWNSVVGYAGMQIPGDSTFAAGSLNLNWGDSSVSIWRSPIAQDSGRFGFLFSGGGATSDTFPTASAVKPMIGIMWNLTDSANATTGWFLGVGNSQWSVSAKGIYLQVVTVTNSRYELTAQRSWAYTYTISTTDTIWTQQFRVGGSDSIEVYKNSTLLGGWLRSGHAPATGYIAMYGRKANTNMKLKEVLYGTLTTAPPPDVTPPTVTMTTPAATNTDTVIQGQSYPITGTLTDAGSGAARIDFRTKPTGASAYTVVGTDATSPYSYSWNTTGIAIGNCDIKLYGYDNAGNFDSTGARTIYIKAPPSDVTAPTLTFGLNIKDSSFASTFTLRSQDAANDSLAIYIDNTKRLGVRTTATNTDTTIVFSISNLTVGSHSAFARGKDQAGNATTYPLQSFTINAPTLTAHWIMQFVYRNVNNWGTGNTAINNNSTDSTRWLITHGQYKNYPFWSGTHFIMFGLNTPANYLPDLAVDTNLADGTGTWSVFSSDVSTVIKDFHDNGKYVLCAIGSDADFNIAAAITTANRTNFIGSLMKIKRKFNYDGFDIDFEHGTGGGYGFTAADTANYRAFSAELRDSLNTSPSWNGQAAILVMDYNWNVSFIASLQQYYDGMSRMDYIAISTAGAAYARSHHANSVYGYNQDGTSFDLGAGNAASQQMPSMERDIKQWIAAGGDPQKFLAGYSGTVERYFGGKLASDATKGIYLPRQSWATGTNSDFVYGQGNTPNITQYANFGYAGSVGILANPMLDTCVNTYRIDTLAGQAYVSIFVDDGLSTTEQFWSISDTVNARQAAKLTKKYNTKGLMNYTLETVWYSPTMAGGATRTDRWRILRVMVDELLTQSATGDVIPPVASMSFTPNNPPVSGTIIIIGSATDAVGVAGRSFKIDGGLIVPEFLTPVLTSIADTILFDTRTISNGNHTLTYTARDAAGNLGVVSSDFVVNNVVPDIIAPTAILSAPANSATVQGNVVFSGTASDNDKLRYVRYYVDAAVVFDFPDVTQTLYSYIWNSVSIGNGSHRIKLYAEDWAGNVKWDSVTITVNNDVTAPTITITVPANAGDTLKGSAAVCTATSTDAVGVVGVTFSIGGIQIAPEDLTSPYSVTFNSFLFSNGTYTLSVSSRDAAGNVTIVTRSIKIVNITSTDDQRTQHRVTNPSGTTYSYSFDPFKYLPVDSGSARYGRKSPIQSQSNLYKDGFVGFDGIPHITLWDDTTTISKSFDYNVQADSCVMRIMATNGWTIWKVTAIRNGGIGALYNVTKNGVDILPVNQSVGTSSADAPILQNTSVNAGDVLRATLRSASGTIHDIFIQVTLIRKH